MCTREKLYAAVAAAAAERPKNLMSSRIECQLISMWMVMKSLNMCVCIILSVREVVCVRMLPCIAQVNVPCVLCIVWLHLAGAYDACISAGVRRLDVFVCVRVLCL